MISVFIDCFVNFMYDVVDEENLLYVCCMQSLQIEVFIPLSLEKISDLYIIKAPIFYFYFIINEI